MGERPLSVRREVESVSAKGSKGSSGAGTAKSVKWLGRTVCGSKYSGIRGKYERREPHSGEKYEKVRKTKRGI